MSGHGLSIVLPPGQDDSHPPQPAGQAQPPAPPQQPTSPVLGITLQGAPQVSLGEQVREGGRMAWHEGRRRLDAIRHQQGGLLHHLANARPPSVQQQCEYAQGRSWVPAGHDRGYMEAHGIVFHAVIGRPGVALGNTIAGIHHRPIVWFPCAAIAFALTITGLCVTGNTVAAVILGLATAFLAVAWCVAAEFVRHALNPRVITSGFDGDNADDQPHA